MRSATLFLIAILTPCAVLGWVSWRSMQQEASDIQGQRTAFYQQSADNAARAAGEFMTAQLRTFGETVDRLLAAESPDELRPRFHQTIRGAFPLAAAGLVFDSETGTNSAADRAVGAGGHGVRDAATHGFSTMSCSRCSSRYPSVTAPLRQSNYVSSLAESGCAYQPRHGARSSPLGKP